MNEKGKRKLLEALAEERDGYQKILSDMRHDKVEKRLSAQKEYDNFASHLGVLSFAVAAAITPVLIIAENEVSYREFLITGISIYLLVGIVSLFNAKKSIESKIDSYAVMNIDLEADVESITQSINKLLWDIEKDEYRKSYIQTKKNFIENHTKAKKTEEGTNYLIDVLTGGFILATVVSVRAIWVFGAVFYWMFVTLVALIFATATVKSVIRAKISHVERRNLQDRYEKVREDYIEWQNKEVFSGDT